MIRAIEPEILFSPTLVVVILVLTAFDALIWAHNIWTICGGMA
jgi:hypothetical protein